MSTNGGSSPSSRQSVPDPLAGARVCLVYEYSLSHSSRYRQEIRALQESGARVRLLTSHSQPEDPPDGVERIVIPRESPSCVPGLIPQSHLRWRPARIADNLLRRVARAVAFRVENRTQARARALRQLAHEVDLFWVSDYLSLPAVMKAAKRVGVPVLYETIDLVPEYLYGGERARRKMLHGERRLIGKVDGFITACDSYADYYMERYADRLRRRPVVCDNAPGKISPGIRATSRPLRLLFMGSLMFDRPVTELIEAMALVHSDVTLTFQGKNLLGDVPTTLISQLGLEDRVRLLEPCEPEHIVEIAHEYDIGVVALRGENENERRASTQKLFTYMAGGLAILGSDLPGIARILNQHHNGALIHGMEPSSWAHAVDDLASLPVEVIDAMKGASLVAAQSYLWEHQRPHFLGEFVRALGTKTPQEAK